MTITNLLFQGYNTTADVIAAIPADRLDAPSPCQEWTVRQVTEHVITSLDLFARVAEGRVIDPAEYEGKSPSLPATAEAYRAAAERAVAAFSVPGALDREFPFAFGPTPGVVIANISLSESLVHGWDIARGAGLAYTPDSAAVDYVLGLQGEGEAPDGMFGPEVPTSPDAPPFHVLLGLLGRQA